MDPAKIDGPGAGPPPRRAPTLDPLRGRPTKELLADAARTASALVRTEVELAKAELRADLRRQAGSAGGLGVAGICALGALQLALTALVLALMESGLLPGWAAALIVAAVVLAIGTAAGLWGWSRRVRSPLSRTRGSLRETVRWAKERIA